MQKEISLSGRFASLQDCLEKVKALLAWKDLHDAEVRTNNPATFIIYDPVDDDLRIEYTMLIGKLQELQELLEADPQKDISTAHRQRWVSQLARARRDTRALNLPKS